MSETTLELSLIIPAYNEERLMASTLQVLEKYLEAHHPDYEILVVDDGSRDGTGKVVEEIASAQPRLRLLSQPHNLGKGYAIQRGVLESRGDLILFMDADLPYQLDAVDTMLEALHASHPVVIGSRHLEGSEIREVPPLRFFAGQAFSLLVGLLMFPGIHDTQCGLKGFRAEAGRNIFQRLTIGKFGFDVEVLYIARKLGYTILPVPVRMTGFRYDSRVNVLRDSGRMFLDLFRIRWNDLCGRYR